jgi:hypothetical protein
LKNNEKNTLDKTFLKGFNLFMKLSEINQTDKAKKKIGNIAKNNNLEYDFAYSILSFHWNYDGLEGEWVIDLTKDNEYDKRIEAIDKILKLDNKFLEKNDVVEAIYNQMKKLNKDILEKDFLAGSQNGNYCYVSKYASYHYLTNLTVEKLKSLEWKSDILNNETIVKNIFLKLFRGGSVDRYNLEYLYSDLLIELSYIEKRNTVNNWKSEYIQNIYASEFTLTDLIKELKQYCKGDKYFLKTVLEALSYSGEIKVENHQIKNIFIPDYRNELSGHYYSNEWTYPLRFWNKK